MTHDVCRYGGVDFDKRHIVLVRQLGAGHEFLFSALRYAQAYPADPQLRALKEIEALGFACTCQVAGGLCVSFHKAPALSELSSKELAQLPGFDVFAEKAGIDLSPARCKRYLRERHSPAAYRRTRPSRVFPTRQEVLRAANGRALTENYPVEEGEEYQCSSPDLTAWYVKEYLRNNTQLMFKP